MATRGYTCIPDWMLELDLDIWETMIYAIIFSFSQDGESTFKGSIKYLSEHCKCSRRKVITSLGVLVEKNLVQKIDRVVGGIHICEYQWCTPCTGSACGAPVVHDVHGGGAPGAPNNIDYNTSIYSLSSIGARVRFEKPSVDEVRAYCAERGNAVDADAFVNFYESKGWKVGSSPMKDWRAAVRTWEKRDSSPAPVRAAYRATSSVLDHNSRMMQEVHSMIHTNTPVYDEQ